MRGSSLEHRSRDGDSQEKKVKMVNSVLSVLMPVSVLMMAGTGQHAYLERR